MYWDELSLGGRSRGVNDTLEPVGTNCKVKVKCRALILKDFKNEMR